MFPRRHHGLKPKITHGSLMNIHERACLLADRNINQGRQWSLSQICEHIALAINLTVSDATLDGRNNLPATPLTDRMKAWAIRMATLHAAFIPEGVQAPDVVQPPGDISLANALGNLENAAGKFERLCSNQGVTFADHMLLGRLDARGWRRFHHVHAAHHFAYLVKANSTKDRTNDD